MVIFATLLLKLLCDPVIEWLETIDWSKVEKLVKEQERPRRGREGFPAIKKLKLVLMGYFKGLRSPTAIARLTKNWAFREICGFNKEVSHDCVNDFINNSSGLIEKVFCLVRDMAIGLGIISGRQQAIDPTKMESPFASSSDGSWSYDDVRSKEEGRDCYYFGYGALLLIDTESHLPLVVVDTKSKKISGKEVETCLGKTPIRPFILHGDAEFDIIKLQEELLEQGVFPLIPINPRRKRKSRKKYRVEKLLKLPRELRPYLDLLHRARAEADHAISTLKERFGLEDIHLKSRAGIRAHLLLCCIHRIVDAIVLHRNYPEESVRRSFVHL